MPKTLTKSTPQTLAMHQHASQDTVDLTQSTQSMVTLIIPVLTSINVSDIEAKLNEMGNLANHDIQEKAASLNKLHFCSITLSDKSEAAQKASEPLMLICEISGDGSEKDVISAFSKILEKELTALLNYCDVPKTSSVFDVLWGHKVQVNPWSSAFGLCHVGAPGHSVNRIKAEKKLENKLRIIVSQETLNPHLDAFDVLENARNALKADPDFSWAFEHYDSPLTRPAPRRRSSLAYDSLEAIWATLKQWNFMIVSLIMVTAIFFLNFTDQIEAFTILEIVRAIFNSALLTVLWAIVIIAGIIGSTAIYLRCLEKSDTGTAPFLSDDAFYQITKAEDQAVHNNLSAISRIKPGFFRMTMISIALYLIQQMAIYKFKPGVLGHISTIHFARWVRVPKTRQLLFFSNYGGSWESYLEDFIERANGGLTSIWSNTENYPKTRFLFLDGAKHADYFKRWARQQQIPTRFWYSAYPDLTTTDIRRNSAIQNGFAIAKTQSEASNWLALFGSISPPVEYVERREVQGLLFGAMTRLEKSEILGIKFSETLTSEHRQTITNFLLEKCHFGENRPLNSALMCALSYHGLRKLGLPVSEMTESGNGFSPAFRQGMDSKTRNIINNDLGQNAPQNWEWGSTQNENDVDLILLNYAVDEPNLIEQRIKIAKIIDHVDGVVNLDMPLETRSSRVNGETIRKEHFGFVDGISQPIIRGTQRAASNPENDIVEPGEFIFGYENGRGNVALSPALPPNNDINGILAETAHDENDTLRDFGKNGSYLVIRQLEQHVEEFHNYCKTMADKLGKETNDLNITPNWIGAKMVGRWPDGSSLIRNPNGEKDRPMDNSFNYAEEDPQGLSCPLGSHIRRTNPRNSFANAPDQRKTEQTLVNRHRILRVGRSYTKNQEKGLMFMCLNVDLERQFEFVQQTWVSKTSFMGLKDEKDPLIGNTDTKNQFVIPRPNGALVLDGLKPFCTMKGGGYFFVPARRSLRYLHKLNESM